MESKESRFPVLGRRCEGGHWWCEDGMGNRRLNVAGRYLLHIKSSSSSESLTRRLNPAVAPQAEGKTSCQGSTDKQEVIVRLGS